MFFPIRLIQQEKLHKKKTWFADSVRIKLWDMPS